MAERNKVYKNIQNISELGNVKTPLKYIDREYIYRLFTMWEEVSVLQSITNYLWHHIVGYEIKIEHTDKRNINKEHIYQFQENINSFIRKAFVYYLVLGMVPWRRTVNGKYVYPEVLDYQLGTFCLALTTDFKTFPMFLINKELLPEGISIQEGTVSNAVKYIYETGVSVYVFEGAEPTYSNKSIHSLVMKSYNIIADNEYLMRSHIHTLKFNSRNIAMFSQTEEKLDVRKLSESDMINNTYEFQTLEDKYRDLVQDKRDSKIDEVLTMHNTNNVPLGEAFARVSGNRFTVEKIGEITSMTIPPGLKFEKFLEKPIPPKFLETHRLYEKMISEIFGVGSFLLDQSQNRRDLAKTTEYQHTDLIKNITSHRRLLKKFFKTVYVQTLGESDIKYYEKELFETSDYIRSLELLAKTRKLNLEEKKLLSDYIETRERVDILLEGDFAEIIFVDKLEGQKTEVTKKAKIETTDDDDDDNNSDHNRD